jgi:hypothetical protein
MLPRGARQAMRRMGVSARAMNVDHSLEAARLRVALEPLGVRKADRVTTIPSSSGRKHLLRKLSKKVCAEDACAIRMSANTDPDVCGISMDRAFRPHALSRSLSCFAIEDAARRWRLQAEAALDEFLRPQSAK